MNARANTMPIVEAIRPSTGCFTEPPLMSRPILAAAPPEVYADNRYSLLDAEGQERAGMRKRQEATRPIHVLRPARRLPLGRGNPRGCAPGHFVAARRRSP